MNAEHANSRRKQPGSCSFYFSPAQLLDRFRQKLRIEVKADLTGDARNKKIQPGLDELKNRDKELAMFVRLVFLVKQRARLLDI